MLLDVGKQTIGIQAISGQEATVNKALRYDDNADSRRGAGKEDFRIAM